jgi:hypothetical protein
MHILSSHTMASKELEPWTLRWVRQQLKEYSNGHPPNDPSRNKKPLAGEDAK